MVWPYLVITSQTCSLMDRWLVIKMLRIFISKSCLTVSIWKLLFSLSVSENNPHILCPVKLKVVFLGPACNVGKLSFPGLNIASWNNQITIGSILIHQVTKYDSKQVRCIYVIWNRANSRARNNTCWDMKQLKSRGNTFGAVLVTERNWPTSYILHQVHLARPGLYCSAIFACNQCIGFYNCFNIWHVCKYL